MYFVYLENKQFFNFNHNNVQIKSVELVGVEHPDLNFSFTTTEITIQLSDFPQ